jgi:hypothetical protein
MSVKGGTYKSLGKVTMEEQSGIHGQTLDGSSRTTKNPQSSGMSPYTRPETRMAGNERRKIEGVGLSIVGDKDVWQGGGISTEMAGLEHDRACGEGGELR